MQKDKITTCNLQETFVAVVGKDRNHCVEQKNVFSQKLWNKNN
jgi:hypothetical protein